MTTLLEATTSPIKGALLPPVPDPYYAALVAARDAAQVTATGAQAIEDAAYIVWYDLTQAEPPDEEAIALAWQDYQTAWNASESADALLTEAQEALNAATEGGWYGEVCNACQVCLRVPKHTDGFVAVKYTHRNKTMREALIGSTNEHSEGTRVLLSLIKDYQMTTQRIRRWAGDNGFQLSIGGSLVPVWKEYGPFAYVGHSEYWIRVDCGTWDPVYDMTDQQGNNFSINGYSELELGYWETVEGVDVFREGNSALSYTFSAMGYAYEIDRTDPAHILLTISTRTPLPTDGSLETVLDENSPHDPILLSFRMRVGPGREIFPDTRDNLPLYCNLHTWDPVDWPNTSPVVTVLWAGHARVPYWDTKYLQVEASYDAGETWGLVPTMMNQVVIFNRVNGDDTYEGVVDLSVGGGLIPWGADRLRITSWFEDSTSDTALPICQDHCAKSLPNFSYDRGVVRPGYTRAKYYCLAWNDLTLAEQIHYLSVGGICRNEGCSGGFVVWKTVPQPEDTLGLAIWAYYAYREKQIPGWANSYQLFVSSFVGLALLCDTLFDAVGRMYKDRDYVLDCRGGWGKMVTRLLGSAYVVDSCGGLEVLEGSDNPGPGANMASTVRVNAGNALANGINDAEYQVRHSLTGSPCGSHLLDGGILGRPLWRLQYYVTDVVAPMIDPDLIGVWQPFEDGVWVMVGFWDANLNLQSSLDEGATTVYRMMAWLVNGIELWKRMGLPTHIPAVVTTVVAQETFSTGITGEAGIALKHKGLTFAKPGATTGDEDAAVVVRVPGSNVLPRKSQRIRNHLCPTAVTGAGATGGFVYTGMVLVTPLDTDLLAKDRGKALPILAAVYNDQVRAIVDDDYYTEPNITNLAAVAGIAGSFPAGATTVTLEKCDTIVVLNLDGVVDRIVATGAGLNGRGFTIWEGAAAWPGTEKFWKRGVAVSPDEEITSGMFKDFYTGKFWFPSILQCLYIKDLLLPRWKSVPLTAALDSIGLTLHRMSEE